MYFLPFNTDINKDNLIKKYTNNGTKYIEGYPLALVKLEGIHIKNKHAVLKPKTSETTNSVIEITEYDMYIKAVGKFKNVKNHFGIAEQSPNANDNKPTMLYVGVKNYKNNSETVFRGFIGNCGQQQYDIFEIDDSVSNPYNSMYKPQYFLNVNVGTEGESFRTELQSIYNVGGLIGSLATHAKVNDYGFIESPFFVVKDVVVTDEVHYLTADEEDNLRIAPADLELNQEDRSIKYPYVPVRYRSEFIMSEANRVDYMGVSPIQIFSVATSLIPFIEHDDANRALMGSNMQRQSVPLLITDRPVVGTGLEKRAAKDSGMVVCSDVDGVVEKVVGEEIYIRDKANKLHRYQLMKYVRSNQDTCINQKPIVRDGQEVKAGDVIADGASTHCGELSLGKNVLLAYMPWEGYNYEDAILLSERCVHDDIFTSVHIEKLEIDARQTKLGPEEITREVPNVSEESLRHLDERGIVRIGARVYADDILVGKVTPKGESEHPPEEKLLRAIFAEKARDVKDNSLRVPHGEGGRVVDVKVFDREKGDELPPGANTVIRVYIAQKRKVSVGDKL